VPKIEVDVHQFRPSGFKYPTIAAPTRDFVTGSYSGPASYNEIVYILGSSVTKAVVTTPVGGTLTRLWTYSPSGIANDDPRTYTFEIGSAEGAERITHGMFSSFNMSWEARGEVNIEGDLMGGPIVDGITLTATPTQIALIPILENEIDVYIDGTEGAIGTTKYTRVLKGSIEITDRWDYLWTVNSAVTGPAAHLEPIPTAEVKITLGADSTGMALLDVLRAGNSLFMEVRATGSIIEGALPYHFVFRAPVKVIDISEFGDEQGLYKVDVTFVIVFDSNYGTYRFTVQNSLTGL
jgi:hypothetical protein